MAINYVKSPTESVEQYNTRVATARGDSASSLESMQKASQNVQTTTGGVPLAPKADGTMGIASQLSPTPEVVSAPKSTAPQLPEPQAPKIQEDNLLSIQGQVASFRKSVEDQYKQKQDEFAKQVQDSQKKIDDISAKEAGALGEAEKLSKPFREQLENAERERLFINKNFQDNQKLVDELDNLLTEGNNIIARKKAEPILSSVLQGQLNKTMEDVNARSSVIQATLAARNGQIGQAYNMIDRSVAAINADRKDQLDYYTTILNYYQNEKDSEGRKLLDLTKEERKYAEAQIGLLEKDMASAQERADKIKEAMIDPDTAQAYAQAGVKLNDTEEEISKKLSDYSYSQEVSGISNDMAQDGYKRVIGTAPAGAEVVTMTDSKGKTYQYYKKGGEVDPTKIQSWVDLIKSGGATIANVPAALKTAVAAALQGNTGSDARGSEKESELTDKITLIDGLISHSGLDSRVGPNALSRTAFAAADSFGAGQDFAGGVQNLVAKDTIATLIDLKAKGGTLGALSDQERILLQTAATKIGAWEIKENGVGIGEWNIDEASFKKELETIKSLTQRALTKHLGYDPSLIGTDDKDEINNIYGNFDPASYY